MATNEIKPELRLPNELKEEQDAKTEGRSIPVTRNAVDLEEPTDLLKPDESRKAGVSAAIMTVLLQTGMLEDLYYALDCNIEETIKLVNLAINATISFRPNCRTHPVTIPHLFIGGKCLSSTCESEFYQRIGTDRSINKKISRMRLKRVGQEKLVALVGTKIPFDSRNIEIAGISKDKDGFSGQIGFSLLAHIPTGQAVGYAYCVGTSADISLIDCYLDQWETIDVKDTDVTLAIGNGFFSPGDR